MSRLRVPGETEPGERSDQGGAEFRVLRGGSWKDAPRYCRSAYRCRYWPGNRSRCLGFRLAVVPGLVQESKGPEAQQEAEPEAGGKPRRDQASPRLRPIDDESGPQVVGGADLNVNFPPRSGGDF